MKQYIYNKAPHFIKNIMVTIYNLRFLRIYGSYYKNELEKNKNYFYDFTYEQLVKVQEKKFIDLIEYVKNHNKFYKKRFKDLKINKISDIGKLPIIEKSDLRNPEIISETKEELIKGYTGGSTGKSLTFYLTRQDFIQRQATLNFFRGMYGYKVGSKIGWFSGKELIGAKEEKKNIFWVKDYFNNITYFSTFHLSSDHIDAMIEYINESGIEYLAGFPSAIYEIAKRWQQTKVNKNIDIKAIFPTAEPLYEHQKTLLENFFDCPVPDQYASSEGAPFIYECPKGSLHCDVTTGVFETINETNEVLVTSFTTHAIPLIRYKIGDEVIFENGNEICECGSCMPLVKKIVGRSISYVYSKERGKVTVSNISNVVKYLNIIDNLQLIQDKVDEIHVKVVCPNCDHESIKEKLEYELRYRLGDKIKLIYEFVAVIPHEKNGKYMMIKNSLNLEEV